MSEIEFICEEKSLNIPCNPNEKIGEIINRFFIKINQKKDDFYFIYGGGTIDQNLTFNDQSNNIDKERKKMVILVEKKIQIYAKNLWKNQNI